MPAGPTVTIECPSGSAERYRFTVDWGTQKATTEAESLSTSIQGPDRLAWVFYDVRNQAGG
jgi:hypothetical protein